MQKRLIIILSILIVFLGILLWYLQEKRPQGNQAAQKSIASLTHTVIGKTTAGEIEKRPSVIKKESLGNNQTKYFLDRNKNLPYDEITTKDNVVVLERDIVPENPSDAGYTTVSDFLRDFGTPDKIIRGSKKYGSAFATYIYSSKGFAFLADIYNNNIHDIQLFAPMSVNEYLKNFGQDIDPTVVNNQHAE